jgi:hypothetical protein
MPSHALLVLLLLLLLLPYAVPPLPGVPAAVSAQA